MKFPKTAVIVLAVLCAGCQTPPAPPEVRQSEVQERDLWRAGASVFAGQDYTEYLQALNLARQAYDRENLKLGWFRDYRKVGKDYQAAIARGQALLARVEAVKDDRMAAVRQAAEEVRLKLSLLDDITLSLAERGQARGQVTQAGILLDEAERLTRQNRFEEAFGRISAAGEHCRRAEEAVIALIARYLDPRRVEVWQKWTAETIAESRTRQTVAIVVTKLEKRLTVYRNGRVYKTYGVGLGFNGLSEKRRAGDNATPEGRYRIIRKIPSSQFYRALLINYPNEEDKQRFAKERTSGVIPKDAAIGGDIEIHGGGRDSLTRGCVSMDNEDMDELYGLVRVGTRVTIVGTNETDNYVMRALEHK